MLNEEVEVAVLPNTSVPMSCRVWEPDCSVLTSMFRESGPVCMSEWNYIYNL